MTSIAPGHVLEQLPTTTPVAIFSNVANTYVVIKSMTLSNPDSVPHLASIYLVPALGTAGNANIITAAANIPPIAQSNGVKICSEWNNKVLAPGESIWAVADVAAKVNLDVSYLAMQL